MDFDDELDNIIDEAKGLKGDMTGKKLEFKVIKVKKSPCDDREYRELLMENNMKVLLLIYYFMNNIKFKKVFCYF